MKLHAVEVHNVRHIRELTLDLSAPLTIVAGPNGAGKTTIQQAVLAAMFYSKKETRDSFVSRFDPHTPPTVVLRLSQAGCEGITLTRDLTDDKGEWREGAKTLKKKKEALEQIQKALPISAEAAALLLWGGQADMTAVLDRFPSDGHDLLTQATIKGGGPDPKAVMAELERAVENARKGEKGGKIVGALTAATNSVTQREEEVRAATDADLALKRLREDCGQAKSERDKVKRLFDIARDEVEKLTHCQSLLETALQDADLLASWEQTQEEWDGLDEELAAARKELDGLRREWQQLQAEYRVARDQELSHQIKNLRAAIDAVETLAAGCAAVEAELKSKSRPTSADVAKLDELRRAIQAAEDKMQASGVRYELSVDSGSRGVRVAEDGGPETDVSVSAGEPPRRRIVGHAVMQIDGLRIGVHGKEDISRHRDTIQNRSAQRAALLQRFAAQNETAFLDLAQEQNDLAGRLTDKRNELRLKVGNSSLAALKTELRRLEQAQSENNMTVQDKESCAGKYLPPAVEIKNQLSRKEGEIDQAKEGLGAAEAKRPTEAQQTLHGKTLAELRRKARQAASAFKDEDEPRREPSKRLLEEVKAALKEKRHEHERLTTALTEAEKKYAGLAGQLKQVMPHRRLDVIKAELQEAQEALQRVQVLQEARRLLIGRIGKKIDEMTAEVPVELGRRITEQLSRLTRGWLDRVRLDGELRVTEVGINGALLEGWRPHELSHGERHQAALAVKIAVARALAETHGPVFIMLDDSLVSFDPERRRSTEELLLNLVDDGRLQVVLFTCHTNWARTWKERRPDALNFIELSKTAEYYHARPTTVIA